MQACFHPSNAAQLFASPRDDSIVPVPPKLQQDSHHKVHEFLTVAE